MLTDSEHEVYLEEIEYVKKDIQLCGFRGKFNGEIEGQIPRLKKLADKTLPENAPDFAIGGQSWKIIDVFYREGNLWEMFFCSRTTPAEKEFSVVQKPYPESGEVMEIFGKTLNGFYMSRGRNPALVLDEFLDNQRFTFEIAQKKL
ncbi:MAG: hypothetical protein ACREC8_02885, partial [Limisphaerales bacterium]